MPPTGIPPAGIEGFRNRRRQDQHHPGGLEGGARDRHRRGQERRAPLDALHPGHVGKRHWPSDRQGRPVYPEGFEELAQKLGGRLHPPGRDVRCIVSVGMLTEGWDCNTVTHIVGLRPFMSQLLCEQVVGRGLRRASYDLVDGKFPEEVAKVFGVPFEVIPFKATPGGAAPPREKRHHVHALPEKAAYEIRFPRVEGYTQAIRNRVTVDWNSVPRLVLDPNHIPPEVQVKATLPSNDGRPTLMGPGKLQDVSLNPYRKEKRYQELVFDLAAALTRDYVRQPKCEAPAHVLFPQIARIVARYLRERVEVVAPAEILDVFLSPYWGWVIERLLDAIGPDTSRGEAPEIAHYEVNREPGSTSEVDFWTSREVREVLHSHLNYVVADTKVWEQAAAYAIDRHPAVAAFAKTDGLGFSIPYLYNGQRHDYFPRLHHSFEHGDHLPSDLGDQRF